MDTTLKYIGIVGGVGPHAGIDLHLKIINNTISHKDQDHLPVFHISKSHLITDRTKYLQGEDKVNPAFETLRIIKQLVELHCEVIGIPCNTSHAQPIRNIIDEEVAMLYGNSITVVNMIEASAAFIKEEFPECTHLGLLATMGTYDTHLYENIYKKYNLTILQPETLEGRTQVHSAIYDPNYGIKANSNPVQQHAIDILRRESQLLVQRNAQLILLGCTELPLTIGNLQSFIEIPFIDVTDVLARTLIKNSNPNLLRKYTNPVAHLQHA